MKDCIKCKEHKDLEAFVKDAKHVDGRKNICKTCYNVQNKQWRDDNKSLNQACQRAHYYKRKSIALQQK